VKKKKKKKKKKEKKETKKKKKKNTRNMQASRDMQGFGQSPTGVCCFAERQSSPFE